MANDFCGVLIFVILMVDLAVTKISTHKIATMIHAIKLIPGTVVWPKASMETWPTVLVLAHYTVINLMVSLNIIIILLAHTICPSFIADVAHDKRNNQIESIVDYIIIFMVPHSCLINQFLSRNFEDFLRKLAPTKVTRHNIMVYTSFSHQSWGI